MVLSWAWFFLEHGSTGCMVLLEAWFFWIHGSSGFLVLLGFENGSQRLNHPCWFYFMPGFSVYMVLQDSRIYGFSSSWFSYNLWFSLEHSFTWCIVLVNALFFWIHGSSGYIVPLDLHGSPGNIVFLYIGLEMSSSWAWQ